MQKPLVIFIHGFKSNSKDWEKTINICNGVADIYFHNWNSGIVTSITVDIFLNASIFWNSGGQKLHVGDEYHIALSKIDDEVENLLEYIKTHCDKNRTLFLVAHSMGTKILGELLWRLEDEMPCLKINFMTLAGIASPEAFMFLNSKGINIFNPNDKILMWDNELADTPKNNIGLDAVSQENIEDIKVDIGHSQYANSGVFRSIYSSWIIRTLAIESIKIDKCSS